MAAPLRTAVNLCQKHFQSVKPQARHGHSWRPKRERIRPTERRIFEEVTKPVFAKPVIHPAYVCGKMKKMETDIEFDVDRYYQFLVKQMKILFDSSKMIIVCQRLPCSNVRLRKIFVALKKEGMKLTLCNNKMAREITAGTKLENMNPLFKGFNLLITSPEPKPREMMKTVRKMPELVILGGFLEDRLVSKNHLQEIVKLPSIEQLRGELVSCLNLTAGGKTLSLLNSHQTQLSNNLQQYEKQKQEEGS